MGLPAHLIGQITQAATKARSGGGGDDLRDGTYLCTVEKIACGEMNSGTLIVIAVRIDEALPVRDDVKPNAVGSTVRFVLNFTDPRTKDVAPKAWREFLEALDGADQNTMGSAEISTHTSAVANDENCYRGVQIRLASYRRMNKAKTKELVLGAWKHIAGQSEDTIKARRAVLDGGTN